MDNLLKLNNKNYIYNRQNFDNLLRQNNVFKKINKKNNLKFVLPKINNYLKNKRDNVKYDIALLKQKKVILKNLPVLNIKQNKYNNQNFGNNILDNYKINLS